VETGWPLEEVVYQPVARKRRFWFLDLCVKTCGEKGERCSFFDPVCKPSVQESSLIDLPKSHGNMKTIHPS
jgi:hypothetical protein